MAYKEDHNLFVGGKYGSFKGLQCSLDKIISKNLQNIKFISPESHITVMKWSNNEERELLLATANQTVKVYDTDCKSYVQSTPVKHGEGAICGVSRFNGVLITAVESGQIRLWTPLKTNEEIVVDPEDLDMQILPNDETNFADINAGSTLSCMQHSQYNKNIIGSGGLGNDLKLWDLTTRQNIFRAKNLPDDAVRLAEPIWVSDISFLPQKNSVAVCSRYGYVRVYDTKTQRKPVWALKVPEQSLTCMTLSNEYNLICGLAKGDMLMVDIRMKKLVHKYKGFLGAVRGIACHPTAPYIASVSLDRHVRIHHRDTKALLVQEYLKLPLHCVVMRSDAVFTEDVTDLRKPLKRKKNTDDYELEEYDNMVNSLEKVVDGQKVKKKVEKNSKQRLFVNPFASNNVVAQGKSSDSDCTLNEESDDDDTREDDGENGNFDSDECQTDQEDDDDDSDCMIVE